MSLSSSAWALWAQAVTQAANMIRHYFMHVYMSDLNVSVSHGSIILNVVILFLFVCERVCACACVWGFMLLCSVHLRMPSGR